jgi:PadR family transcriptional regulator AphA
VRHFWPADQSQIYRTLARLAERGLVEMEVVEQEDRPDRKVHRITEAGRDELARWLRTPLPPSETREPSMIQVFFAGQLSDEEILAMFEREAASLREILAHYDEIPTQAAPFINMVGSPREAFFWMLTLEAGIFGARAHLEWVEGVIQRIKKKKLPSA